MSDVEYKYYAVAFIDVLGQRESFNQLDDNDFADNSPKLIEIHKKTAMVVEQLRVAFEKFFESFGEETDVFLKVPENQRMKFREMKKSEIKTYQFVDTILAYTSLKADKYSSNGVNGLHGLLMACGALILLSLSIGRSFRAAIDVGIGTDLKNGEVYGPVSYEVYRLESTIAKYPRIVLGKEIIRYLNALCAGQKQFPTQIPEDIKLSKLVAEECKKMIIIDFDGHPILDYLGEHFNKGMGDDSEVQRMHKDSVIKAYKFVKEELERRRGAKEEKLILKYSQLLNYFNSKLK